MKTITQFQATDGRVFSDEKACRQYEADGGVEFFQLPDYGDHGPIDGPILRWCLEGDGSGYYATADKRSRIPVRRSNHPKWATHVIYFGK